MSKINKIKLSGTTYDVEDANASKTVELTQAQYDALVQAGTVDPNTFYIITDAQAVDLSEYWTSGQTQSAIDSAVSGKADYSAATVSMFGTETISSSQTTQSINITFPYTDGVYYISGGSSNMFSITNDFRIGYNDVDDYSWKSLSINNTGDTSAYTFTLTNDYFYFQTKGINRVRSLKITLGESATVAFTYKRWADVEVAASTVIEETILPELSGKQDTLSAGTGIDITNNVISVTGGGGGGINSVAAEYDDTGSDGEFLINVNNGQSYSQIFKVGSGLTVTEDGNDVILSATGGGSITIDPSLDSGSTNAVANSAITNAINSKVNISDNNVSAFSGVQLAIAENTYYGDKNIRTIYIKSIGGTKYTDAVLCNIIFGNNSGSTSFKLSGSTSVESTNLSGAITAYTINDTRVAHSLNNGVISVTFNNTSYHLLRAENVQKDIGIYYTKGGYSSGQTADVLENTVYDVLTELGENLVNNNNNNNNFVTLDTAQDITATKTFVNTEKGIIFKQKQNANKIGFSLRSSASTNNEIATFEFKPNTYTDSSSVSHPLLYLGHYRTTAIANNGIVQTMVGFRQYDQSNSAAYHYLMPLPAEAKTPFSLTTAFKNYFAPLGFKNGSTMITTDNTGVADFSDVLGGLKLVKLTQTEYDNLGTKDSNTLYVITTS